MHCVIEQDKVHGICLEHAQSALAFGGAQYLYPAFCKMFIMPVNDCRIPTDAKDDWNAISELGWSFQNVGIFSDIGTAVLEK